MKRRIHQCFVSTKRHYMPFAFMAVMAVSGCVSSEPVAVTAGDGGYAPPPPGYLSAQGEPMSEDAGRSLQNSAWRLVSYGLSGAERSLARDAGLSIRFATDNQITGTGGCNSFFTSYQLGPGNALSLGPIGRSRKICPAGIMTTESEYFEVLQRVSAYALSGDDLRLYYDGGAGMLHFTPG